MARRAIRLDRGPPLRRNSTPGRGPRAFAPDNINSVNARSRPPRRTHRIQPILGPRFDKSAPAPNERQPASRNCGSRQPGFNAKPRPVSYIKPLSPPHNEAGRSSCPVSGVLRPNAVLRAPPHLALSPSRGRDATKTCVGESETRAAQCDTPQTYGRISAPHPDPQPSFRFGCRASN